MAQTLEQLLSVYNEEAQAADAYVNDLLGQAGGDRDFAIKQLKRDHELALGTDDQARAKFLESVADKLEQQIGTIPYDYQVGTTRTQEDLTRTTELTNRNKNQALARLAEDEKVWKDQFADTSKESRITQQESLLKRGILSGTRGSAQGLAGSEVRNLEKDLGTTLSAYERELGRSRKDIETQASDVLSEAQIGATRKLEDLKTSARRGATTAQDTLAFGSEAANRQYEAKKKELERLRAAEKSAARASAFI